ncbi:hypothetical protein [Dyadobacter sp. 3J3]|uniref:hypothetical protein n=1 Tax=Dyadobacter sp. 3J3 TaxID=2606600 RepID=UPI0013577020|nr:hypothetical protein [Dyadobacter sp. 3J3]
MMNRYPDLSNTRRAAILCQLFEAEIPALLGFMASRSQEHLADPQTFQKQCKLRLFGFERWLALAKQVNNQLHRYQRKDARKLFVSLFEGYKACYSGQLLSEYVKEFKPTGSRFSIAVRLLFM